MWQAVLAGISGLGSAVGAFFGFKKDQANVVQEAIKVIGSTTSSNADREAAIATIISAEANSDFWMAATWRPMAAMTLLILIVGGFFGYVPPNFNEPLSPMMKEIFDLFKICLTGYIPARSIEKIISSINIGRVLRTFIEKKLG